MPGEWITKPWGQARELFRDDQVQITEIVAVPGGYCSVHRHLKKDNTFIVLQGELEVILYPGTLKPEKMTLRSSSKPFCVEPGVPHLFRAVEGSRAIEVYRGRFGESPDPDDIERSKEGGVRKSR